MVMYVKDVWMNKSKAEISSAKSKRSYILEGRVSNLLRNYFCTNLKEKQKKYADI